jgi:hypothetical protein
MLTTSWDFGRFGVTAFDRRGPPSHHLLLTLLLSALDE